MIFRALWHHVDNSREKLVHAVEGHRNRSANNYGKEWRYVFLNLMLLEYINSCYSVTVVDT